MERKTVLDMQRSAIEAPRIWTRRPSIIEPRSVIDIRTRIEGRFTLEVKRRSGRVVERRSFKNLITDQGLNRIGAGTSQFGIVAVGTGSAAPSVSDTQLSAEIANRSATDSNDSNVQGSEPYFGSRLLQWTFGEGAAEGNLSEVGVGWTGTPVTLFSRALILDDVGSPTTISVASDEFLSVTYEIRLYPWLVDLESMIDISGDTHDIVSRAANVTSLWAIGIGGAATGGIGGGPSSPTSIAAYDGAIGAITSNPTGSSDIPTTAAANATYGTDNFYRDFTLTFGLADANFGSGISSVMSALGAGSSGGLGRMQLSLSPAVMKTSDDIFSLLCRHSWARTPESS